MGSGVAPKSWCIEGISPNPKNCCWAAGCQASVMLPYKGVVVNPVLEVLIGVVLAVL